MKVHPNLEDTVSKTGDNKKKSMKKQISMARSFFDTPAVKKQRIDTPSSSTSTATKPSTHAKTLGKQSRLQPVQANIVQLMDPHIPIDHKPG